MAVAAAGPWRTAGRDSLALLPGRGRGLDHERALAATHHPEPACLALERLGPVEVTCAGGKPVVLALERRVGASAEERRRACPALFGGLAAFSCTTRARAAAGVALARHREGRAHG